MDVKVKCPYCGTWNLEGSKCISCGGPLTLDNPELISGGNEEYNKSDYYALPGIKVVERTNKKVGPFILYILHTTYGLYYQGVYIRGAVSEYYTKCYTNMADLVSEVNTYEQNPDRTGYAPAIVGYSLNDLGLINEQKIDQDIYVVTTKCGVFYRAKVKQEKIQSGFFKNKSLGVYLYCSICYKTIGHAKNALKFMQEYWPDHNHICDTSECVAN